MTEWRLLEPISSIEYTGCELQEEDATLHGE
jgi:hypothetical protein